VLIAGAGVLLTVAVNLLSALLALAGAGIYVFVYTLWLKRRTPQNIVLGGLAGAIPPLVGWAAATGSLAAPAWIMFAIVALWTPPHFWSLALLLERHYTAAEVPMLPVVVGSRRTARSIFRYSLALVAVSLLPGYFPSFGDIYVCCASVLGAAQLALGVRLLRQPAPAAYARLFAFSLLYLPLLFIALAATSAAA
jgi:heme o synthase